MALLRRSWGQRLVTFGLLGLLNEDPTGGRWFGLSTASVSPDGGRRCVRVLLSCEDAEERLRLAYKNLLLAVDQRPARAVEACGS